MTNGEICADGFTPPTNAATQVDGCHRSHPHENMDSECERKTEIARATNAAVAAPAPTPSGMAMMMKATAGTRADAMPTPRTDAEFSTLNLSYSDLNYAVYRLREHARQLERELAAARKEGKSSVTHYRERAEKAEAALAEEKKLSAAINRDCNNTANERNEAQAKLFSLLKRLDDAEAGLPEEPFRMDCMRHTHTARLLKGAVDDKLRLIDYAAALRTAAVSIIAKRDAEIANLSETIAYLKLFEGYDYAEKSRSLIAEKDAEIARLREDAALLDWLEKDESHTAKDGRYHHALFRRNMPITRTAIDAARGAV